MYCFELFVANTKICALGALVGRKSQMTARNSEGTRTYQVWDEKGNYKGVRVLTPVAASELIRQGFSIKTVSGN